MHFSISIGKSNAFISCLLICSMKLTPFRKQLLIFWQIFCDLTFYLKIQCVSAFLSQNPMRSFHAFPSIAKSNAFLYFYRKIKCVALFETKTKVFSTNSCNPPIKKILVEISNILVRISNISVNITSIYVKITNILVKFSFRSKSQTFSSKSRTFQLKSRRNCCKSRTFLSKS